MHPGRSSVVHADETDWRQNGVNGYVWTLSTATEWCFLRRGRKKVVVDEALGDSFRGVLVSDFYAAYHHYPGPKQRAAGPTCCGISTAWPSTPRTPGCSAGRRQSIKSMLKRKPSPIPTRGKGGWPNRGRSGNCWPAAAHSWMTRRRFRASCVGAWRDSSRNCSLRGRTRRACRHNPAEPSLRTLVISRKISGGIRSGRAPTAR